MKILETFSNRGNFVKFVKFDLHKNRCFINTSYSIYKAKSTINRQPQLSEYPLQNHSQHPPHPSHIYVCIQRCYHLTKAVY